MSETILAQPFAGIPMPEFAGDDECTVVFHPPQHEPPIPTRDSVPRGWSRSLTPGWLLGAGAGITATAAAVAISSLVGWSPYQKPAPELNTRPAADATLSSHAQPAPAAPPDVTPAYDQAGLADPYSADGTGVEDPALGNPFDPQAGEPTPGLPGWADPGAPPYPQPPPPEPMAGLAQPAAAPGAPAGAPTTITTAQPPEQGSGDLSRPQRRPAGVTPTSLVPDPPTSQRPPRNRSERAANQGGTTDHGSLRGPLIGLN